MKKRLSHIASFCFLFFLLLPLAAVVLLQGAQWYLKVKAPERMEKETLVTITLPLSNVRWEKKEKEILLNGKLFDIKSFSITDNRLTATGFFDHEETTLAHLLSYLPHDKKNNLLLHLFFLLQCFPLAIGAAFEWSLHRHLRLLPHLFTLFFPQPSCLPAEQPPRL